MAFSLQTLTLRGRLFAMLGFAVSGAVCLGIWLTAGTRAEAAVAGLQPPGAADARGDLIGRYCATCHNDRVKTAGLVLNPALLGQVGENVENVDLWEKVVVKLRNGAMPPPGASRPDQGHAAIVRTLLARGANVHARSVVWQQLENTAGNTNSAGDFLMSHGGSTAILFAARQGDLETAAALLEAGADVNDASAAGTSALVVAAHSDHGPLARLLLSRGAAPNAAEAGYTALHAAVLRGNLELVKALLEHGADPDAPVRHGTPGRRLSADYSLRHQMIGANGLWLAARFGHPDIMRVLAAAGASALVVTADGTTALKAAMGYVSGLTENREGRYGVPIDHGEDERATLEAARTVVEMGADLNAVGPGGDTALHDAARQRFVTVIEFLVKSGADPNIRNRRKQTPLGTVLAENPDGAAKFEVAARQDTIDLLRKLGASE
jgi:ankyrin repeat protein